MTLLLIISTSLLVFQLSRHSEGSCDSRVFCQGKLLHTVQMAGIFSDSKTFVDLKMINDEETTLRKFDQLLRSTKENPTWRQIKRFVEDNFQRTEELEAWVPPDFTSKPKFLEQIQNEEIRNFAQEIVNIWPTLARKMTSEVKQTPELFTLLPVDNGFIVPGGRFREFYYWDSYWIIKGLLLCEMYETVKGMLDNFILMVKRYGFVPNGARIYYLNRSQPPVLTLMVAAYIEETNDIEWLGQNINILEKELDYFFNNKMTQVVKNGIRYDLAHYICNDDTPRPESYYEDIKTASTLHTEEEKRKLYSNLKSAAESGWDFSSRWIFDKNGGTDANLTYTNTQRVIPVDLNAFLCQAFRKMFHFYMLLQDYRSAIFWLEKANTWQKAINEVFYDRKDGIWYDWDNELSKPRKLFYASNFAPLIFAESEEMGRRAAEYLTNEGILEIEGGIPSSLIETGEQWDYPNGWAPLQSMVILALDESGDHAARKIAQKLAQKWIESNLVSFRKTGKMFEKYNVEDPGESGFGGEYIVQNGFGWTNGVLLELINRYYT